MNDHQPEDDARGGKPPPQPHKRRPRYPGKSPAKFHHRYKELQADKYPGIHEHIRSRGRTPAGTHVPVLLAEVMHLLSPRPGEVVADCTLGYGGHARQFMERIGREGLLVGFDVDAGELERTRRRLAYTGVPMKLHRMNYAGILKAMHSDGLEGFDIIFADIGVSSMQVDDPSRGVSYKHEDAPLDMRMDDRLQQTGADLLNTMSQKDLSQSLWELSDEPDHERIAAFIVQRRAIRPIETTGQLADIVFNAKGTTRAAWKKRHRYQDQHPAARTFQAVRILVNDELGALRELLRVAPQCLKPGGRIGIISFHSGEDKIVKKAFRLGREAGDYSWDSQIIRPGPIEVRANPRSSSACFRWAIRAARPS